MSDKKVYGHTGRFVALRLAAGPSDLIDWLERDFDEMVESRDHWKQETAHWLAWSDGQYPDDSPGDVIAAYQDGTIVLDDGITTWNPVRACAHFAEQAERAARLEAERDELLESEAEWQRREDRAIAAEARAATLEETCARLGNKLAQERAKPGGSWDQAAHKQLQEHADPIDNLAAEIIRQHKLAPDRWYRISIEVSLRSDGYLLRGMASIEDVALTRAPARQQGEESDADR